MVKRLTKAGKVDKRYKNGRNPKSHTPKPNAGRKQLYKGEKVSVMLYTTRTLLRRLLAEAKRHDKTRNQIFNRWLEDLPPTDEEKEE